MSAKTRYILCQNKAIDLLKIWTLSRIHDVWFKFNGNGVGVGEKIRTCVRD